MNDWEFMGHAVEYEDDAVMPDLTMRRGRVRVSGPYLMTSLPRSTPAWRIKKAIREAIQAAERARG